MIRHKKFTIDVKDGAMVYRYKFYLVKTETTAVTIMEARAKNTETWRIDDWSASAEEVTVFSDDVGGLFRKSMLGMLESIVDLDETHPLAADIPQDAVLKKVRTMTLCPADWQSGL